HVGPDTAFMTIYGSDTTAVLQLTGFGLRVPKKKDTTSSNASVESSILPPLETHVHTDPGTSDCTLLLPPDPVFQNVSIQFFDVTARLVGSQSIGTLDPGSHDIALSLPQQHGPLFLRVTSNGETIASTKIITLP